MVDLAKFMISLENNEPVEMVAALCGELNYDVILPVNVCPISLKAKKREVIPDSMTPALNNPENKNEISAINYNDFLTSYFRIEFFFSKCFECN